MFCEYPTFERAVVAGWNVEDVESLFARIETDEDTNDDTNGDAFADHDSN